MSTPTSSNSPDPERAPEPNTVPPASLATEEAQQRRRPWWLIVAVLAVALVLIQLALYAFRNQSSEEGSADRAGEARVTESVAAPQGEGADAPNDSAVPTEGGYVDSEGEQQVPYEAAPGQFDGIDGMAMNIDGAVAAVDPVQLTDAGALIPPADVSRLGWYSASAVPGAEGAVGSSVITGHINYQGQGTGYASRFANMAVGDEFDVVIDSEPRTFRVTQAPYRLPKGSDFPPEVNDTTGSNRLVLITCGGQFVGGALGYADNIITVAEPVVSSAT